MRRFSKIHIKLGILLLLCAGQAWGGVEIERVTSSGVARAWKHYDNAGTLIKVTIFPDANITDYGAAATVGSIAWAFAQLSGSATQPVEIELLSGTYSVQTAITQDDYESLICRIPYGAVLKCTADAFIESYIYNVANYATTQGVKFWSNDKAAGVGIIAKTRWNLIDCWVKDVYGSGSSLWHGFDIQGGTYGNLTRCKAEGPTDDGISIHADGSSNQSGWINITDCEAWGSNHGGAVWESGLEIQDATHDILVSGFRAWDVETGLNNHGGSTSNYAYNITIKNTEVNSVHFDYVYYSNIDVTIIPGVGQSSISIAPSEPQFNYMKGCIINVVAQDCNLKFQYVDSSIVNAVVMDGAIDWNYGDYSIVTLNSIRRDAVSPTANLTSDCNATATTLSIADTTAWRIGQVIQVHDGDSTAETVRILSKTATDITFTPAVTADFTTAQTAHIQLPYWNPISIGGDAQYNTISTQARGFAGNIWSNGATGYFNNIFNSQKVNVQTCTGNITIYPYQGYLALIDPNGGDRTVTASGFSKGDTLVISNVDDAADPGNSLSFHGFTIAKDQRYWFYYTGSVWNVVFFYDATP